MFNAPVFYIFFGPNRRFTPLALLAAGPLVWGPGAGIGSAALVFACLRPSTNFFRFSGIPLFFAALLLALVKDFAAKVPSAS